MDEKYLLSLAELYAAVGDPAAWPAVAPAHGCGGRGCAVEIDARHCELATNLHTRLMILTARLEAFACLINQLPQPVVIVDAALQVLIIQQRAQSILERNDGLGLEGHTLVASRHDVTVSLRTGVQRALHENIRISLRVRRPAGGSAFAVLIAPFPRMAASADFQAAAMLMITDPDQHLDVNEAGLRQLYGLTRAEARVASLLMAGKTLDEAADVLCVSLNTVRTHLQRIFSKTETSRQAHLLRTLLLGPASIP